MLKFKLGNGKTIKANFEVLVVGKSQEGRERAVDWLCNHLVIEPGKELKKTNHDIYKFGIRLFVAGLYQ